jgi:hypothetical protein
MKEADQGYQGFHRGTQNSPNLNLLNFFLKNNWRINCGDAVMWRRGEAEMWISSSGVHRSGRPAPATIAAVRLTGISHGNFFNLIFNF